jgi:hypothetical protein
MSLELVQISSNRLDRERISVILSDAFIDLQRQRSRHGHGSRNAFPTLRFHDIPLLLGSLSIPLFQRI